MALRDLLILQRALDDLEDLINDPRVPPEAIRGYEAEYERLAQRLRVFKKHDRKEYE